MEKFLNKVIQGDCLELLKQIPDESIDLVVTDPPYGMSFQSNYRKEKHLKIENDSSLEWLPELTKELFRVLKNDTHAYIFCSFHHVDVFKQELQKLFKFKNILVWIKNNTGMGDLLGDYAPQYEFCLFITKGNKKLNNGRDSNILYFARTGNELHPTQKPVELISFLVNKSSEMGGVILDPFLGSGTTALACKQMNRNYIGIELNKDYCDIAQKRLDSLTQSLF